MKVGCNFARFTWEGGPAALGATAADAVAMADDAGYSVISAMDHFFQIPVVGDYHEPMLDGYTFLGFAAGHSTRADLQLLVTGVTYRHPGLLAKVVTTLDVLSGGRARLGIGAAWNDQEHVGLGVPFPGVAERFQRLDECLHICRQMWSDDEGSYVGMHYQLAETVNSPQNVSTPHPEIMIGGMGPNKTLRLAARHADAVNWFSVGVEELEAVAETLARHCEAEGTDPTRIRVTVLGRSPAAGEEDRFVAEMEQYSRLGVDEVFLAPTGADPRPDIDRWAATVLPRLASL